MSDYILLNGDKVKFNSACGLATLQGTTETTLSCSAKGSVKGQAVCVEGDEKNVVISCKYISGAFTIPGEGTLKIDSLGNDQKATKTNSGGKPVLLQGSLFTAKFEVILPAMQPQPAPSSPIPDQNTSYTGNGTFESNNKKWKGL